ncbi:acetyl-CoA synthetase [Stella humosa]|uniref:acetate--CoA ligase n=1 Tax=Stella humosa TaxID=94 RepID=A0A3N1L2V2_9PROT|nr:AMP-binding protein [Stella humosa]ROP83735.1 acetyl-CoA synthetase [Stella humosa]BBK33003.1 acetyl-CoA synthetase [Stella humosa]
MTALPEGAVWAPSAEFVAASNWQAFMTAEGLGDYAALERRADADPDWFWAAILRFLDVPFARPWTTLRDASAGLPWVRWCVGGTTNLAMAGIDRHRTGRPDHPAVIWEGEGGQVRTWTYAELGHEVDRLAAGLAALGIGPGSPVGLYMPMVPEAVAGFLALARLGAVILPLFSGFGAGALATRLGDGEAVAVLAADSALRRGRRVAMKSEVDEAAKSVPSLRHVVVLRQGGEPPAMQAGRDHWWHALPDGPPAPTRPLAADAPLLVAYTSGTTGRPKGTVHTHIGFLAKTMLDFQLCFDLKPSDRLLWMTDIGWLVGPIQIVAATTLGATLVLAEGTPDFPEPDRLWRIVARHRVSFLGLGPTIARLMARQGEAALAAHDLSALRLATSTGEPWDERAWMWVFRHVLGGTRPLLNYAGGTEVGGILATNILQPIKPASFNGPIPGSGADIVDEDGRSVPAGTVGELVMRQAPMGMTQGLWREPDRYIESYWSRLPGIWVHGDWASRDGDGYWYIHGRSDDTIKLAGKRTGPAEIEAALLATGLVVDAAAVALPDPVKGQAVACVVVAAAGQADDNAFRRALSDAVAAAMGSAFRPGRILVAADLPKTRNMKTMRRVVRAALTGESPGDLSTLVNPEAYSAIRAAAMG